MNDDPDDLGPFLPVGTKVLLEGGEEGLREFGIVVHCWKNEEIGAYDCYVAFFGDEFPSGPPKQIPYVLRYLATSLKVVTD